MDTTNLLDRIRSGDESALTEIYKTYREPFFAYLHKEFDLGIEDVKEVFQLSVVLFYDNVVSGKLKELSSSPKTYLFAIGKNKARDLLRSKHRISEHLDEVMIHSILEEDGISIKEQLEKQIKQVVHALEAIGDPCQKLLQLFYYRKMSMAEIGAEMAYKNVDTVKTLKYKCIKRLQKIYERIVVG